MQTFLVTEPNLAFEIKKVESDLALEMTGRPAAWSKLNLSYGYRLNSQKIKARASTRPREN
jgi:hypothetical protein